MNFKVTSPSGIWDYANLLGASVKIKSLPVKFGFAYAADELYEIEDIGFRISRTGQLYTGIRLKGVKNREFVWKDLEVVGLRVPVWAAAWCGMFCAGNAICGYIKTNNSCGTSKPIRTPQVEIIRIERIALDETDLAAIERYFFGKYPEVGQRVIVYGRGGDKEYILDPTFGWTSVDGGNGIKIDNISIIQREDEVYQVGTVDGGEL